MAEKPCINLVFRTLKTGKHICHITIQLASEQLLILVIYLTGFCETSNTLFTFCSRPVNIPLEIHVVETNLSSFYAEIIGTPKKCQII